MDSKNNKARGCALALVVPVSKLPACGGSSDGSGSAGVPTVQPLSAAAIAGEALFNDKSLSVSGQQSCATCHVKSRAFAGDPSVDKRLPVPAYNVPAQCQPIASP